MISLNILNDMCQWWPLWWILPFLLGLLLGWAIWAKWQNRAKELEEEAGKLKGRITELESELAACRKDRTRLRGELAICEGRFKELAMKHGEDISSSETSNSPMDTDISLDDTTVVSSFVASPPAQEHIPVQSKSSKSTGAKYAKLKEDNLQIIEGVGPKMESVLHDGGIGSWSVLAAKTSDDLRGILDGHGGKYRIIDPSKWAEQAAYARDGDWDGLIAMQKEDGSVSKAEKVMIKLGVIKAYKENDLKAIEGIGPKIEQLLNNANINTWQALSDTSVDRLKSILMTAGSRFQLADPASWPKQSGMAARGQWDELEEYQAFLNGGKDPG